MRNIDASRSINAWSCPRARLPPTAPRVSSIPSRHSAAASNLGQMLNRLCLNDGVSLVNIVRKKEQEDLLKAAGAVHVCRTDSATFLKDLTDALAATGATIGFDAIGGGPLAGQILGCMEAAVNRGVKVYSRYGW